MIVCYRKLETLQTCSTTKSTKHCSGYLLTINYTNLNEPISTSNEPQSDIPDHGLDVRM
jgi:hypothetical protein